MQNSHERIKRNKYSKYSTKINFFERLINLKMPDRLKDLPELVFKKIFRFSDIESQANLYKAYDTEKDKEILQIINGQKPQVISCWLCQISVFLENFFLNDGIHRLAEPASNYLRLEPKRGTMGFNMLYKLIADHPIYGRIYRQRNMKDPVEMTEPDELFLEFQNQLASVPSFDNFDDLLQHQQEHHIAGKNITGINSGFWDESESMKSKIILH